MDLQAAIKTLAVGCSIDSIIETPANIIACGYEYDKIAEQRSGVLYLLHKDTMQVIKTVKTSGSFEGVYRHGNVYVANYGDVSLFTEGLDLLRIVRNGLHNTCICAEDDIYVGNLDGSVSIFDLKLEEKGTVQFKKEPIWTLEVRNRLLYVGDEAGWFYRYRLEDGQRHEILNESKGGIIDIFFDTDEVFVSSYSGDLVSYDACTLSPIRTVKSAGALWKTLACNEGYVSACIYDGVRVFDKDFGLKLEIRTDSICYAVCIASGRLIWSPFYHNQVKWLDISSIYPCENFL